MIFPVIRRKRAETASDIQRSGNGVYNRTLLFRREHCVWQGYGIDLVWPYIGILCLPVNYIVKTIVFAVPEFLTEGTTHFFGKFAVSVAVFVEAGSKTFHDL